MIAHTSYVFPVAPRRRLRGLGQDCGGANQPPCGQTAASAAIQALQPTVQNPQYSTQITPGTPFTTTTYTLDSYMAKWAAEALAFPGSLGGADPVSEAIAQAQSYCATEGVAGCDNLTAIATKYGNQVAAALPSAIASVGPAATTTGTTYTQQHSGSPGAGYVWDGTCWRPAAGGSCWSPPSSSGASSSTTSGGSTSTVVNPSPATQTVTDGSSLTSPTSVTSLANGTSVTTGQTTSTGDIIPGIPNAAVFLGGGAALVFLVLAVQR